METAVCPSCCSKNTTLSVEEGVTDNFCVECSDCSKTMVRFSWQAGKWRRKELDVTTDDESNFTFTS